MTSCPECGYDWACPTRQAVATVQAFPTRLTHLLHEVGISDGDQRLRARPSAQVWSPLEYVAHTGEAIGWYSRRIARVLAEQQPQLEAYDWDLHTAGQDYHRRHLDDVLGGVSQACVSFSLRMADLTQADWQRQGIGSDGTPRTAAQLVHRTAHEAHHHLHDIRAQLTLDQPAAAKIRDGEWGQTT